MLSDHEQRILDAMERRMGVEDPALASLMVTGPERRKPLLTWRRLLTSRLALVVAALLAFTGCGLHLSALGVLFFAWAVGGMVARSWTGREHSLRPGQGSPYRGHPTGLS